MSDRHVSVLKDEALEALQVATDGIYIDATLGGAGHAIEIVKRGGYVLGIDQDTQALAVAQKNIAQQLTAQEQARITLTQGNFRDIAHIAKEKGFVSVDGILFDLGVSSFQLDTPERGFSYRFGNAPLDLRMNQSTGKTAADLIHTSTEEDLYEILATYGEEPKSKQIAEQIIKARAKQPIDTVADLIDAVQGEVKAADYSTLSRVFQALRIAVNDELGSIKMAVSAAESVLKVGGRLVVISFHSLEDRIIKRMMQSGDWKVLTKHPIVPGEREMDTNRRSRSAKMRVAEKV